MTPVRNWRGGETRSAGPTSGGLHDAGPSVAAAAGSAAVVEAIDHALTARAQSGKAGIAASVLCHGQIIATGKHETGRQCDQTRQPGMMATGRAVVTFGTTGLGDRVIISTLNQCKIYPAAMRFVEIARVEETYLVLPHLSLSHFLQGGSFKAIGRACKDDIRALYSTGDQ